MTLKHLGKIESKNKFELVGFVCNYCGAKGIGVNHHLLGALQELQQILKDFHDEEKTTFPKGFETLNPDEQFQRLELLVSKTLGEAQEK